MLLIQLNNISFNQQGIAARNHGLYLDYNTFNGNSPRGAVSMKGGNINNNLFYDNVYIPQNESDSARSIINLYSETYIWNSTIADNISESGSASISISNGSLYLYNTILWNNASNNHACQIYLENTSETEKFVSIRESDIQGGLDAISIIGNINLDHRNILDTDPLFEHLPNGRYQLSSSSPCIDAGEYYGIPACVYYELGNPSKDLLQNSRIFPPETDIGAYEKIRDSVAIIRGTYPSSISVFDTLCLNQYKEYYIELHGSRGEIVDIYKLSKDGNTLDCDNPYFYQLDPISYSDAGTYTYRYGCEGSGCLGCPDTSWYSKEITLTIPKTIHIQSQTHDISSCPRLDTTLFVDAVSDDTIIHYAWYRKGTGHIGTDTNLLQLKDLSLADTGFYYCIASDDCSRDTSQLIHINVIPPPELSLPADSSLCFGDSIVFELSDAYAMMELNGLTIAGDPVLKDTGSYYLRVWSECGESTKDSIHVFPKNLPPTSMLLDNNEVSELAEPGTVIGVVSVEDPDEDDHELSIVQEPGTDYQFFIMDGNLLMSTQDFDYESQPSHTISIRALDLGDCELELEKTFEISVIDETEIGIPGAKVDEGILIYPNPFSTAFTITTKKSDTYIREIRIYSITGTLLRLEEDVNSSEVEVKRNDMPSGIYELIIITNQGTHRNKLFTN